MATGDEGLKITGSGVGGWFRELDQLLRGELTRLSSLRRDGIAISPRRLSYVIVVLAMSYGFCMGTFALFRVRSPGIWQLVASMVKVPLALLLDAPGYVAVVIRLQRAGGVAADDRPRSSGFWSRRWG